MAIETIYGGKSSLKTPTGFPGNPSLIEPTSTYVLGIEPENPGIQGQYASQYAAKGESLK